MEGEETEREDASHLPYDDRRHSRSVILNGSPTKEVPTQGPNDNSPSQMASLTASQMASQMTDMTPYDLQSGETYTMSTLVVPASFVAMTTTQEFEERKAEEKKAKEDEQRLQEEAEEAEDLKLKEEERRIAESKAEQLDSRSPCHKSRVEPTAVLLLSRAQELASIQQNGSGFLPRLHV